MTIKNYLAKCNRSFINWVNQVCYYPRLIWFSRLLLPFSWLFYLISRLRYHGYHGGLWTRFRSPVPVIVVGNITMGGTGKTPLIIYLANFLAKKGYKPAIISRGYGGSFKKLSLVTKDSNPKEVGDEAILLAKNTEAQVIVAKSRVLAIKYLSCQQQNDCDVILSDDGLQHYAIDRDIEIAVIDGIKRFGNQNYIPAGPLREPISRLQSVTAVVGRDIAKPGEFVMKVSPDGYCYHMLTGEKRLITDMVLQTIDNPIHAVAAIGFPWRFFNMLRDLGFNIEEHPFPDHYFFSATDIHFNDDRLVIMTEKDAVKCYDIIDSRHWYLPVKAQGLEPLCQIILAKLINSQEIITKF